MVNKDMAVRVPGWLVRLLTTSLIAALVGWGTWVTTTNATQDVEITKTTTDVAQVYKALDRIESKLDIALREDGIHSN